MAKARLTLTVKTPWWANSYIRALNAFAFIHGLEPDSGKCARIIVRHSKFEVISDGQETKANR